MIDRENVIKTLEYNLYGPGTGKTLDNAMIAAINLLKEKEPVPPEKQNDGSPGKWASWWYVCGSCGREIDYHDRFCQSCGQEVKWE